MLPSENRKDLDREIAKNNNHKNLSGITKVSTKVDVDFCLFLMLANYFYIWDIQEVAHDTR